MKNSLNLIPGFPDFHKHCLVDMYTRASSDGMKKILEPFMADGGKWRLLKATSAFGMGVGCPGIYNVVHIGPPSSFRTPCSRVWQSWAKWNFI